MREMVFRACVLALCGMSVWTHVAGPTLAGERFRPRQQSFSGPEALTMATLDTMARMDKSGFFSLYPNLPTLRRVVSAAVFPDAAGQSSEVLVAKGLKHMDRSAEKTWRASVNAFGLRPFDWTSAKLVRLDVEKIHYPVGPDIASVSFVAYLQIEGKLFGLRFDDTLHFDGRWYLADDITFKGPIDALPPKAEPKVVRD